MMKRLTTILGPLFGVAITLWWVFWAGVYVTMLISAWHSGIGIFVLALLFGPLLLGVIQFIVAMPIIAVLTAIFDRR